MDVRTGQNQSQLRIDYSRVNQYVGPEPVKLSFWDKLKRGFAKFGSVLGSVGQVVAPLFGPLGVIGGAASYGVRNVSDRALQKMSAREQFDLSTQSQPTQVEIPGFMEESAVPDGGFVAPSYLEDPIMDTIQLDQAAKQGMIQGL